MHDLANLRLVCHDFAVRAAPALFENLSITFRTNTFSKPSRLAALHRLGFHTKHLTFRIPQSVDSFLPPLVEPETGEELSFTYTPRIRPPALREPKYGDSITTEILTRQYPPLFHAATNVHSFISAFSAFVNLSHLHISCPGGDNAVQYRRSTVDYALVSLRIAVERNCLNALDTLTLSPMRLEALHYLTPLAGYGSTPVSFRKWSRIQHLTIHAQSSISPPKDDQEKVLQSYLLAFKNNLLTFIFRWDSGKHPIPASLQPPQLRKSSATKHPALKTVHVHSSNSEETIRPLRTIESIHPKPNGIPFPRLRRLEVENASASAGEITAMLALHKHTLEDLDFRDITLTKGTWEEAFAPLTKMAAKSHVVLDEEADIPIMLSPTAGQTFPRAMDKVQAPVHAEPRRSLRASRWLGSKRMAHLTPRTPLLPTASAGMATKIVRQGLLDCEAQVKKVLKGRVFAWM